MSSTNTSSTSTMNASKKSGKKPSAATTVPEVAAPAPVAATPAPAPSASKKSTPKPSPAATLPAPEVAAPTPAPVAATTESGTEASLADELKTLQDQLTAIRDSANAALASLKRVGKRAAAEIKAAGKKRKHRNTEGTEEGAAPKPTNLKDPVPISDELAAFLGMGKNSTGVRPNITQALNKYAKDHGLTEGQKIKPDAALKKLLRIDDSVELTIFNMQTYLKPHYPPSKSAKKDTPAA
jgi:chromatin remodeling complex protein RSC6